MIIMKIDVALPLLSAAALLAVSPIAAQENPSAGSIATSLAGRVGQRQTRTQMAPLTPPMARINSRIANRVQSRIRNRVDRNYSPQGNPSSPFAIAEGNVGFGGTSGPR